MSYLLYFVTNLEYLFLILIIIHNYLGLAQQISYTTWVIIYTLHNYLPCWICMVISVLGLPVHSFSILQSAVTVLLSTFWKQKKLNLTLTCFLYPQHMVCIFIGDSFLLGARCSSVVRAFALGAMGHRINPSWGGPIELFIGRGMCYPVCGMVHIKEPLLLIRKSSPCGGSGFPLSLSEWSFTICATP